MQLNNTEIVIATHNKGKIPEISSLVKPYGCIVSIASDYNICEPVEDGLTFEDNALLKARHSAKASTKVSLADDSGLCVVGLDNKPGINSARYAGAKKDFNLAIQRINDELNDRKVTDMSAFFVCCLAIVNPITKQELFFRGEVHGQLTFPPRGNKGFGYDPIFIPDGYDITFGEMEPQQKHLISHRGDAFRKMKEFCFA